MLIGALWSIASTAVPPRASLLPALLRTQPALIQMAAKSSFRNPNNLPTKTCVVCDRPFTWRKKWEDCWDDVTTCSKRCNNERKKSNRIARGAEQAFQRSERESNSQAAANVVEPPPRLTISDKVAVVAAELDVDVSSLPLVQAVASCNEVLGLESEGGSTVAQQVEVLMRELSTGGDSPIERLRGGEAANGSPGGATALLDAGALETGALDAVARDTGTLSDASSDGGTGPMDAPLLDVKAARKAAKKERKAEKRARRDGTSEHGQKACDLCARPVDTLIRCQMDSSKDWKMACGRCWKTPAVAGGVVDGDGANPHYRYGGLWKNLHRRSA